MFNYDCKMSDFPFDCAPTWEVFEGDRESWTLDKSVTLECKRKGANETNDNR